MDLEAQGPGCTDENAGNENAGNESAGNENAGNENAGNENAGIDFFEVVTSTLASAIEDRALPRRAPAIIMLMQLCTLDEGYISYWSACLSEHSLTLLEAFAATADDDLAEALFRLVVSVYDEDRSPWCIPLIRDAPWCPRPPRDMHPRRRPAFFQLRLIAAHARIARKDNACLPRLYRTLADPPSGAGPPSGAVSAEFARRLEDLERKYLPPEEASARQQSSNPPRFGVEEKALSAAERETLRDAEKHMRARASITRGVSKNRERREREVAGLLAPVQALWC